MFVLLILICEFFLKVFNLWIEELGWDDAICVGSEVSIRSVRFKVELNCSNLIDQILEI